MTADTLAAPDTRAVTVEGWRSRRRPASEYLHNPDSGIAQALRKYPPHQNEHGRLSVLCAVRSPDAKPVRELDRELETLPGTIPGAWQPDHPSLHAGEFALYSYMAEELIPAAHRAYVRRHVDRAAARHNLGPIAIWWFEAAPSINRHDFWFVANEAGEFCGGITSPEIPMVVCINSRIRGPMVKAICAHEVRHVAQDVARAMLSDMAAREADAEAFSMAYMVQEPD